MVCGNTRILFNMLERMWINQPSTLQPLHEYNRLNVIADLKNMTVYPVRGSIISMQVPKGVLSKGWCKEI